MLINLNMMREKLSFCVFLLVLTLGVILHLYDTKIIFNFFTYKSFKAKSTVMCLKEYNGTNLCKFKNICYDAQIRTFLFFLGEGTLIKGLLNYQELQKIQLSSLNFHNRFYANLSVIIGDDYTVEKPIKVVDKGLLFSRFKPNNIMHCIHDDLLPIFLTLESHCLGEINCIENFNLVIHDEHSEGVFFNLYEIFSKQKPIILNQIPSNVDHILCFKLILTGLVQDGIFYQYGFEKPHGPVNNPFLTQNDISRFSSFVRTKLKLSRSTEETKPDIVLVTRKKNRKILNFREIEKSLKDIYREVTNEDKVNLITVDLISNGTKTFIKTLSEADVFVGMHGAEMIFSLFMKPKSAVAELFPYAIQPDIVSFVKPLANLKGSSLFYMSWRNMDKNKTRAYPHAHSLFGGIAHLDDITQEQIVNMVEVPSVKCCHNSTYLYHMYQDTIVSDDFKTKFHKFLLKRIRNKENPERPVINKWFYPYTVNNITCKFHLNLRELYISWFPPFNVIKNDTLKYSLYIADENNVFKKEIFTELTNCLLKIPMDGKISPKFHLWISVYCTINNSKSSELYLKCR